MAITSGRQPTGRQPDDRQPVGRQPGSPSAPATPGTYFSEGTQVDDAGIVQIHDVAYNYSPGPNDIYILGTLHDENGVMYVSLTDTTLIQGDVYINQIRHGAANGVRRGSATDLGQPQIVSKGFLVSSGTGRAVMTASPSDPSVIHGIQRDTTGDMVINSV